MIFSWLVDVGCPLAGNVARERATYAAMSFSSSR
jgi:hypothetical protein